MSFLNRLKRTITPQIVADEMLFSACQKGNYKLAETALELGANVNATKKIANYHNGSVEYGGPEHGGDICLTPLVVVATSAFNQMDDFSYKQIAKLLIQKGADTSKVVVGSDKLWISDYFYIMGVEPDETTRYEKSLANIVRERTTEKISEGYSTPSEAYPISDSMAAFLGRFLKDELKEKEAELNKKSAKERKVLETAVAQNKNLPAEDVMFLRRTEERARLKAYQKWLAENHYNER